MWNLKIIEMNLFTKQTQTWKANMVTKGEREVGQDK